MVLSSTSENSCQLEMSVWSATALLLSLLFLWLTTALAAEPAGCEVHFPSEGSRQLQWPPHLMVPVTSKAVYLDCSITLSADANNRKPYWAVGLSGDAVETHLQFNTRQSQLNEFGVYELPAIETPGTHTLRLLVNDIARNNGTMVFCVGVDSESYQTTLMTYDPTHVQYSLETLDIDMASVTLSWSPMVYPIRTPTDTPHNYSLIIHSRSGDYVAVLDVEGYTFTAPKDAPPCEVYNFSVTATYVGATYTGDGCSVPSPVLSTMLPSLPDIEGLDTSISHTVARASGVVVNVVFEPPRCCDAYPILNYTLQLTDESSDSLVSSSGMNESTFTVGNLTEDTMYTYRISVSNSVGSVSSEGKTMYTTDVQTVKVKEINNGSPSLQVECRFITGSGAQGCVVVLQGSTKSENVTRTIKRHNMSDSFTQDIVEIDHPPSCYEQVIAYDLEYSGLVGTLPVPGELLMTTQNKCPTNLEGSKTHAQNHPGVIAISTLVIAMVLLSFLIVNVIAVVYMIITRRKLRKSSPHDHCHEHQLSNVNSLEPTSYCDGQKCRMPDKKEKLDTSPIKSAPQNVPTIHGGDNA